MKSTMKTYAWTILLGLLVALVIVVGSRTAAIAEVSPGDYITASNVQKIKGLVPDFMYEYVQKGWITMKIGKLSYDPREVGTNDYKEYLQKNVGRYGMNAKGEFFDKKTGEIDPMDLIGVPYPVIDVRDPQAGLMMLHNHMIYLNSRSNTLSYVALLFIGKKLERYIIGPGMSLVTVGTIANNAQQEQCKMFGPKIQSLYSMKVTDPYELNGLATMTYQYADNTPDKVFAYVPALRRTRVLTAAARSDAMFGTDLALDDASGGFMGKARDFTCKYIRTQDGLARFNSSDILKVEKKPDGSYQIAKSALKDIKWGFATPGWTGKPWATVDDIWAIRKMHVIQCNAKDPYYGYGMFELWYDPDTYNFAYKVIYDKANKRWKTEYSGQGAYCAPDYVICKNESGWGDTIYDEQRDHGTGMESFGAKWPPTKYNLYGKITASDYTMTGFAKFSK